MTRSIDKILAIVPARGGSKRFPRKNLALLAGRPLIVWTIDAALASGLFEQVCVSSDDEEIMAVAESAGATPVRRDRQLATDTATVRQVCTAVVRDQVARGESYGAVYVLLPTSPLRTAETMHSAWGAFAESHADALASVSPIGHPPEWLLTVEAGLVFPIDSAGYDRPRSVLPKRYRGDGAHHIVKTRHLLDTGQLLAPRTLAFHSPPDEAVDIDEPRDLAWAEFLLSAEVMHG